MPSSIENIVDRFPFPTINLIAGTPDNKSIVEIHLKLNSKAASVQSNLRFRTVGLLSAVYSILSNIAFFPPVNPGPEPNITTGATGSDIANLRYHYTEATKIFTK